MHTGSDGMEDSDTTFDTELLVYINSAFSKLIQLGFPYPNGYRITENTEWTDIVPSGMNLGNVEDFIYLSTRLKFDPPANSSVLNSFKEELAELTYRIETEFEIREEV